MRISQVMLAKGFGGAERSFVDIAICLAQAGHAVQAICQPAFSGLAALAAEPRIRIEFVRVLGTWDPFARRRLRALLAGFGPEVVHAHLARAAHLAGHAAHDLDLPVLVKTHNYVDLRYYRAVDRFVATTRDQADWLRSGGIGADRIDIIPNFSRLLPREPRVRSAGPVRLLAYGRFVHKKGFDLLLEALARQRGDDWHLTLGGDGPERGALQACIARLELGARVGMCGWIDDVGAVLAQHDVFVLPSRDEPFGIAVLEAMAAGVPIVATRTQGPREILDADTALLAEPGDGADLAAALERALGDAAGCLARAREAQRRYRGSYSAESVVPRYLAAYDRLRNCP
ncbi:MAG: glycosyltransferase family 4 protein [Gammaproteobacteria bacterium]